MLAYFPKFASGVALVCLAIAAHAQNPFDAHKQFSATLVISGAPMGGHGPNEMKIYRSGDKMRTSIPGGMGYIIADMGRHVNYMVMSNDMCMESTTQRQQNPFAEAQGGSVERTPAGSDTVDGHPCKVENVTVTPQNGTPRKMKVWLAEDLREFPVKVESESSKGPVTILYKDVSFDQPAASLFAHPADCRQMPGMPGGPQ